MMTVPPELQPLHTKITRCLEVISYHGDLDVYAAQLIELALQRATLRFVGAQPETVRQMFGQKLTAESAQSLADQFASVIEPEQFLEVVNQECQQILMRWAQTVLPLLTEQQIEALKLQVNL